MKWKRFVYLSCLVVFFSGRLLAEEGIYTNEYCLSIYPDYPPLVGQEIKIRLRTFKPARKVTLYSDREKEIPLSYRQGYWWGKFKIPPDYQEGSHFFTVWIKYIKFKPEKMEPAWIRSMVWYRSVKEAEKITLLPPPEEMPPEITAEAEEEILVVTGEAVEVKVASLESFPFIIKGSKTMAFTSRSIEGSKEGFAPGVAREESLRLNISGKNDGTEIEANLISTSTAGTTQLIQREDKISVLVRKASTEAYLGDFTADLNETEFTKLNKVLSGVRLKGNYQKWGFQALYSSPKGEAKFKKTYGDGTQGPFSLDAAPVVIDSDRVRVDGVLQKRGDDYAIDYQAGTITFTKKTIDPKSILEINYDYSQAVYQHATYGLRLTAQPLPTLKIGATYLNDSDGLAGAAEARQNMQTDPVDPQSHYVAGADGAFVSENITANGEVAYSNKNLNLLSSGSEEAGQAVKLDLSSQLGMLGVTAHGKRISAKFRPLADPNPKQAVTEYGGTLSLRPGSLFGAQGNYNYDKYTQSGVVYENYTEGVKVSLTPDRWPSLEYNFYEQGESNDPVSGDTMRRVITRNSAETNFRLGWLSSVLRGTAEKWRRHSPSEEVTDYKRVNFGLATAGLEKVTFTSNVEIEHRLEPLGAAYRKTYNVNLSATPVRPFFIASSLQYLDDSVQGITSVADLSYRLEAGEIFRTDGKYTVTAVKENYATAEAVSKQSGSFSLDLRPAKFLRLRYLFKPSFTLALRTNTVSFNNEQQQAEINLIPLKEIMLGVIRKVNHGFNVYPQDPDLAVKENTLDTESTLYTLKMAPWQIFSVEFNYLLENGSTTQRATAEPLAYTYGKSFGRKFDIAIKTSIAERFSIDSRYVYQNSFSDVVNNLTHTASLKGIWNVSDAWSLNVSGAYVKSLNYLSSTPVTYTLSPGGGISYRQGEKIRVDLDCLYSRSFAGAVTEKINYSLRAKYSLSEYVNITLRGEREESRSPDYRLTDIAGNIEINL